MSCSCLELFFHRPIDPTTGRTMAALCASLPYQTLTTMDQIACDHWHGDHRVNDDDSSCFAPVSKPDHLHVDHQVNDDVFFCFGTMSQPNHRANDGASLCFAPASQPYNHGSNRLRPLHGMPFDLSDEVWIGNRQEPGARVWPHPSFNELVARFDTNNPKWALPDTVAKDHRFQCPRLACCGGVCSPAIRDRFIVYEKPSRLELLAFGSKHNVSYSRHVICALQTDRHSH
jgi:hypothetical protein